MRCPGGSGISLVDIDFDGRTCTYEWPMMGVMAIWIVGVNRMGIVGRDT
jgi:hypothetical protein